MSKARGGAAPSACCQQKDRASALGSTSAATLLMEETLAKLPGELQADATEVLQLLRLSPEDVRGCCGNNGRWNTLINNVVGGGSAEDVEAVRSLLAGLKRVFEARDSLAPDLEQRRPFGLPLKLGQQVDISREDWEAMRDFVRSKVWLADAPALPEDSSDPLLKDTLAFGDFMLGFDFHLTDAGPRLIEINTNAGGLASAITLSACCEAEKAVLRMRFVHSLLTEYRRATGQDRPSGVAIVDDHAESQGLHPEMAHFCALLRLQGIPAVVASPEDLEVSADGRTLRVRDTAQPIDFVYNRLVDFRLEEPRHEGLRRAALAGGAVVSPHPASYARVADKRLLSRLSGHPVVPVTMNLSDRPLSEWEKDRKRWVFKPPAGNGSRGVYRGNRISLKKLRELPGNTIAQEFCPPKTAADGSKYDVRVFAHGGEIIGLATRHFTGQVLEMRSDLSGFCATLPAGACCVSTLVDM